METGEVLAYAGNATYPADERRGNQVDIITSPRSTGSILKPFLYAGMLHDGLLLPSMLVSDVPLNINGFSPHNYNKTFYGAVPAHVAIERSLNVPLVRMLSQYNTGRFMSLLKSWGMTTLRFSEEHYGASLILGGAEGTLWDLSGMYASMSRVLKHYRTYNGRYNPADIHPLTPFPAERKEPIRSLTDSRLTDKALLSSAALWYTFEAMSALNRPEEEADWQQFESMKRIAWKTGTSYGGRDAWAIGTTPRYVVGVWAGNASGEGRPGLTGVGNAAPVLFDLFSLLPGGEWFDLPYDETLPMAICRNSGHKASPYCEQTDTLYMPLSGNNTGICPYHKLVHLSADGRYRVNSSCESVDRMISRPWFVLPPAQEYYYRNYHIDYIPLPPVKPGCGQDLNRQIEKLWRQWCKARNCDVTGEQSFTEILRMAVERKKVDGGILFLFRHTSGGVVPFKLQAIEVDELDVTQSAPHRQGNRVVGGIEYNSWRRPVGYWIQQYDLEGWRLLQPIYIDAKDAYFLKSKRRPSQIREMSDMSHTITRIRDVNEFINAVSVKERIAACLAVLIKKTIPTGTSLGRSGVRGPDGRVDYAGKKLGPGMIMEMGAGDEAQVVDPKGAATDATAFLKVQQGLIGAGQGLSYEAVSRDMSGSTYSSARQNAIEDEDTYAEDTELLTEFMSEVYEQFIISCYLSGVITFPGFWDKKAEYMAHDWVKSPKKWIDPAKESTADKTALQSGQKTYQEICAERGKDWRQAIDETAEVLEYGREKGIEMGVCK